MPHDDRAMLPCGLQATGPVGGLCQQPPAAVPMLALRDIGA